MHYGDDIMGAIASQITSLTIVYSTAYSDADQRKHQSSASLAFVWGIHRRPVNSPHKGPVTRKMFPFDDVIMVWGLIALMLFGRIRCWPSFQLLLTWHAMTSMWYYHWLYAAFCISKPLHPLTMSVILSFNIMLTQTNQPVLGFSPIISYACGSSTH